MDTWGCIHYKIELFRRSFCLLLCRQLFEMNECEQPADGDQVIQLIAFEHWGYIESHYTLISFYFMNSFRYSMFNAQLIENLLTFPLVLCLPAATHDIDRIHEVQSTNGEKVFS